ncbi:cytochrome P450 4g15-like [Planococcus citri]|uniref:cytochrome P450 4g15-like n=1 Tax=Planococcus citri TaxID=170843 RepID=UPI0031F8F901
MMAMHQDVQQKAYDEITQLSTEDGRYTENHLTNNLKYLEQCIKETLRMFSPVVVTSRFTHKEITLTDNLTVPANVLVVALILLANKDPDLYKNPQRWDPEHFSDQAIEKRSKNSQLSFGYGARTCIGSKYAMMSIKTQIAYILRNYHLSTSVKELKREHLKADLSIRSRIGYPIKFTRRREMKQ